MLITTSSSHIKIFHIWILGDLHILLHYTLMEMSHSVTIWENPKKIWSILATLDKYGFDSSAGITWDAHLEYFKTYIYQGKIFLNIFVKVKKKKNTFGGKQYRT